MRENAMIEIVPGLQYYPDYLDDAAQRALVADLRNVIAAAPLFTPTMPRTGKPFSVRMTNCGPLGWLVRPRRLSLSGDASGDGRALARDAARRDQRMERAVRERAAAASLPREFL